MARKPEEGPMNLRATITALADALEADEEYAEECETAGRRQEAMSVRSRVSRLRLAQDEIAVLVAMARTIVAAQDTGEGTREQIEAAWARLRELAVVTP